MNALNQIANYLKIESNEIKRCEKWANVWFVVIAGKGGRFVSKSVVTAKAQITSIRLERWEGCPEPIFKTVANWEEANAVLAKWALSITHNAYDKCDIFLTFSNSSQYKIVLDLGRNHSRNMNLAQVLMTELKFFSGDRPSHMNKKDYQEYLEMCQVNTAQYQQRIQDWEIPA